MGMRVRSCLSGATTVPYGLAEDVRAAAGAGFESIEVWRPKLESFICEHGVEALADLLDRLGIGVASIAPWPIESLAENRETVRRIRRAAEIAARLGGDLLVAVPGAPPAGAEADDAFRLFGERLRPYGDAAAACGVRIAVETRTGHPLLADPRAALRVIRAARHPAIGLAVGLGYLRAAGVQAEALADLPADRIWLVRVTEGEGIPSFAGLLRTLEGIGYAGAVSVEIPREEGWDRPIEEIAARAMEILRGARRIGRSEGGGPAA
ncbi:MAG: sugar phosphate isomerase/epimerase [Planctomycetes bacterium]|nr:sugar phosphate isomerase/epimerase [Planctomycetota bacterium]